MPIGPQEICAEICVRRHIELNRHHAVTARFSGDRLENWFAT